jgi:hypothetical protein
VEYAIHSHSQCPSVRNLPRFLLLEAELLPAVQAAVKEMLTVLGVLVVAWPSFGEA